MEIKRINLIVSVFIFTICLVFTFGSLSLAQCPSDYPYDCEDGWCCINSLACLLPEELRSPLVCTEKTGIECPVELLYGESSEETALLRKFRDDILSRTQVGQAIITQYYEVSPLIAKAMEEDEQFKEEIKEMIDEVLMLLEREPE